MNFSFRSIFSAGDSLKKQVLFYTIVPMVVGIFLLSYFSISSIISGCESRIKTYGEELTARKTGVNVDNIDALMITEKQKASREARTVIVKTVVASCAIIIAYFFFVNFFINKYLSRPLALVTTTIKNFTDDLTVRIPVTSKNEIGELANGFNNNIEKLHVIINNVSRATLDIQQSVKDITEAVSAQAAISSQQSAAVAEITSTAEELSASSSLIAEHSRSVVDIASRTWENTKKGGEAIESVIVKMNEIDNNNQKSINEIIELGKKTKEISKIMDIINNIADQTKLIAFNAALEASSAGEAGKRFGVVAVEIRRLADSVMESTGEIESKINEIKEATNRLVIASEKGSKGIHEGIEYTNQTADLLIDVVNAAQSTTDAAKQISLSTQQQKTASSQVVAALRDIVTGTNQTTKSINRIESISKGLMDLSLTLKELTECFMIRRS
ncbi:MAG: methyl-accepting chemotaxis protein [Thermodesulfovibrionales bacterium]